MDDLPSWIEYFLAHLAIVGVNLIPSVGPLLVMLIVARVFIVLPLRQRERTLVFLDLLEVGIKHGRSPEHIVTELASLDDKLLSKHFGRLTRLIQSGSSLGQALAATPGLLCTPVVAILQTGERLGDLPQVLPVCRAALSAAHSRAMGVFHYLPVFSPLLILLAIAQFIAIIIMPTLVEIVRDLGKLPSVPLATQIVSQAGEHAWSINIGLVVLVLVGLSFARERSRQKWSGRYERTLKTAGDWLAVRMPWRRKRLQRDFSAMLAVLLDRGLPEADSVTLAARSTGNRIFIRNATTITEQLHEGASLTEAIGAIDETGEFRWRLRNAAYHTQGFRQALQGWHDALDAKAFQQEQAAAHTISSGLIVLNGVFACIVALSVFQPLIIVMNDLGLW